MQTIQPFLPVIYWVILILSFILCIKNIIQLFAPRKALDTKEINLFEFQKIVWVRASPPVLFAVLTNLLIQDWIFFAITVVPFSIVFMINYFQMKQVKAKQPVVSGSYEEKLATLFSLVYFIYLLNYAVKHIF